MAGKIKNLITGVHIQASQETGTERQWCRVLHCSEMSVDDDVPKSFRRPNQFFETGAAHAIVDHVGTIAGSYIEYCFLDVVNASNNDMIGPGRSQVFSLLLGSSNRNNLRTHCFGQLNRGDSHRRTGGGNHHILIRLHGGKLTKAKYAANSPLLTAAA